jgi:hypothetical protein
MKGVAMIIWALLVFGFLVIFTFTTVFVYRYRITIEINYEYNYDNVQLTLLTLLSSTHDKQQIGKMLSENFYSNQPIDMTPILKEKLDKLIDSKCYTLKVSDLVIEGSNTECKKNYAAKAKIVYPYNPQNLTGDVLLVVG